MLPSVIGGSAGCLGFEAIGHVVQAYDEKARRPQPERVRPEPSGRPKTLER
jgi:hypothetical protein